TLGERRHGGGLAQHPQRRLVQQRKAGAVLDPRIEHGPIAQDGEADDEMPLLLGFLRSFRIALVSVEPAPQAVEVVIPRTLHRAVPDRAMAGSLGAAAVSHRAAGAPAL